MKPVVLRLAICAGVFLAAGTVGAFVASDRAEQESQRVRAGSAALYGSVQLLLNDPTAVHRLLADQQQVTIPIPSSHLPLPAGLTPIGQCELTIRRSGEPLSAYLSQLDATVAAGGATNRMNWGWLGARPFNPLSSGDPEGLSGDHFHEPGLFAVRPLNVCCIVALAVGSIELLAVLLMVVARVLAGVGRRPPPFARPRPGMLDADATATGRARVRHGRRHRQT